MEIIRLAPVTVTGKILRNLEQRGLIRTLAPTKKAMATRSATGAADTLYTSAPRYGTHTLICVGKRSTDIKLSYHLDNEEFILVKPSGFSCKPLYLVVGLHKSEVLARKAKEKKLGAGDFIALKLVYNNGETCIFSLLKHTVHWEATVPGPGQHPVFFVSEPSRLKMQYIRSRYYRLMLKRHGK